MIEASGLTKRYGRTIAVDDLTFTARQGRVTGFLGPNGAGKSTVMRMILSLDRPTAGRVTAGGARTRSAIDTLPEFQADVDLYRGTPQRSADTP